MKIPSKIVNSCLGLIGFAALLGWCGGVNATTTQKVHASKARPPAQAKAKLRKPQQATLWPEEKAGLASYGNRAEVQQWVHALAQKNGLQENALLQLMAAAKQLPEVIRLMTPPVSRSSNPLAPPSPSALAVWQHYRPSVPNAFRVQAGLQFWQAHADVLAKAETTYGVPAEVVVGILGVETMYGRNMGRFRVLDALTTLAFDFPSSHKRAAARQAFFRDELAQFLIRFAAAEPQAALQIRGSYAGAMGQAQFMPSSWVKYAVDFDQDGKVDLFQSPQDAIGSVAHYLQQHGWKSGLPTHFAVQALPSRIGELTELTAPDILPTWDSNILKNKGLITHGAVAQHAGKLALVGFRQRGAAPAYVWTTENFYAITRYNWSATYAMSVIELGRSVSDQIQHRAVRASP